MIGSISPSSAPARYRVPGVYYEPHPRAPETRVRTDVAGFIGFEPRLRAPAPPASLFGIPVSTGHEFRADVPFVALTAGPVVGTFPGGSVVLSSSPDSVPLSDGQSIAYAVALTDHAGSLTLLAVAGGKATGTAVPPGDAAVAAAVIARFSAPRPWVRLADVTAHRQGNRIWLEATPTLAALAAPPTASPGLVNVQVSSFQLLVDGVRGRVPGGLFTLSSERSTVPDTNGKSITFAVAAARSRTGFALVAAAGPVVEPDAVVPPDDPTVAAAVVASLGSARHWVRIADVHVRREGNIVWQTTHPALSLTRCDDWSDFLLAFGTPVEDGTLLATTVRAYFTNGGSRCYVATVRRPSFADGDGLDRARQDMVGVAGSSEAEATGLERLLLVDEVSFIDVPDLYARQVAVTQQSVDLPPPATEACFLPCPEIHAPAGTVKAIAQVQPFDPLFPDPDAVFATQRQMLLRCVPERWRVLLLFTPPLTRDNSGVYRPPSPDDADAWRHRFLGLAERDQMSCAALYYPWVLAQDQVDAPVEQLPPTPFAAGVIARRDLARGPFVAPANETLRGVVGVTWPLTDDVHGRLYQPDPAGELPSINVLRPFPGLGVQVWGARTLSTDTWLRYLPVRRGLSAIERRAKAALDAVAFEPNTPLLWLQVVRLLVGILQPVFASGALRGDQPAEAFYVRCDASLNPPEQVEAGMLLCEVGVAIAAAAEFLVFRVGRQEGVVEVVE
jgi:hypothetical protein